MIQICLNKKCSYTDANGIFSVRSVQFFCRIRLQNQFPMQEPYFSQGDHGSQRHFLPQNRSLALILRSQMECFTAEP